MKLYNFNVIVFGFVAVMSVFFNFGMIWIISMVLMIGNALGYMARVAEED